MTRVGMQWDVRIPVRDGTRLSAILYRAEGAAPGPVILTLTPYVAQAWHDVAVWFAERGLSFLSVDLRGRGNSEGEFWPNRDEARDGHDVVEWAASQDWCDGQVGMWGGSYAGFTQWSAAKERPRGLKTIVPVASPLRGVDSPVNRGVFMPYSVQWLTLVAGRTGQEKIFADGAFWRKGFKAWAEQGGAFRDIDRFLGLPSPIFQEWLSHPEPDAYWDAANPTPEQYAALDIPVLTITGIYDGDQPGALAHYRRHMAAGARAPHCLVMGPWDHPGTRVPKTEFCGLKVGEASLVDLPQLHLDWYAWTLGEGERPAFLKKDVAYYVMGADEWRWADTLDAATDHHRPLYLYAEHNPDDVFRSGDLLGAPASSPPDQWIYDPSDTSLADLESTIDWEDRADTRMLHASIGRQLVYHSAPFDEPTEVTGFFGLSVWLSIDQPDTDIRVSIHEVGPDGRAEQLTVDWMRARYREDERRPRMLSTTEPLRYDFERFLFTSRRLKKGSRLRLVIGPTDSIFWQRNRNSGRPVAEETRADGRPVTVRLYHDGAHPAVLRVPIGRA